MPEVHQVYATVRPPRDAADVGQVTVGYYTLVDGVLTMTDSKGAPVRNSHAGEKYTHKIDKASDAPGHAKRMTLQIYRMLGGDAGGGFNRSLNYRRSGVA
jgi:hypothetical protein